MRNVIIAAVLLWCLPMRSQVQGFFTPDSLAGMSSPLDLDSLYYWFEADAGVLDSLGGAIAENEGVGTWQDQSGNGYHLLQSTNTDRPVWKATGGPGGKPCIQFDGADDFLASAAHWWGTDSITIFAVIKFGNATRDAAETVIAKFYTTGNDRQWRWYGTAAATSYAMTVRYHKDGTSVNFEQSAYSAKSTTWRLHTIINGFSQTAYEDGVSASPTNTVYGTGDGTIFNSNANYLEMGAINSRGTPSTFWNGSVSAMIITSAAESAATRAGIWSYLNRKYDIY